MTTSRQWLILGAVVLLILGTLFVLSNNSRETSTLEQQVPAAGETVTVSYSILDRYHNEELSVPAHGTVLSALQSLDEQDPELALVVTEYEGIGTLVEGMYGYTNGTDGQYWHYTVNDVLPMVGADTHPLSEGDTVHWVFGEFE
jgi:hypothetical protein